MSVATKLEYLNNTKQLLKENINNLGGNLTTEPFRQYASVLEGIYESLPKVSGIGASLSLSPSMVGKIKLNEIQGDTLQNGTPTPSSPVPIQSVTGLQNVGVCGKNLLNVYDKESTTINGVTYSIENGELTLNGTTTATIQITNLGKFQHITGQSYTWTYIYDSGTCTDYGAGVYFDTTPTGITNRGGGAGFRSNQSRTATITDTGESQYYYMYMLINNGTTFNNYKIKLQIVKGTTANYDFEPYKGNTYEVNLGKNLLDLDYTSQTINGVTFIINNDKSITLNGTSTSSFSLYDTQPIKLKAGTYTHSSNQIKRGIFLSLNNITATMLNGNNNVTKTTFTISQDTTYTRYLIYIDNNITFDNYNLKLQLEKGSTNTSYSPYFTPIELNKISDYDSIKKSTGKNLFDKDNANVLNGNLADGGTLSSTNNARTLYIPCKNNTTYTITKLQAVYFRVAQFTNIPAIGDSYISRTKDDTANSITFTTTTGNYLAVTYWYNSSTNTEQQVLDSIMINEGSTALPYEPYGKVWYIEENTGEVVLNGSETWSSASSVASGTTRFIYNNSNFYNDKNDKSNNVYVMSNLFKGIGWYDIYSTDTTTQNAIALYCSGNGIRRLILRIENTYASTPAELQAWLGTHNVKVKYVLATPTYTVITNTELIEQLESLYNAKSKNGTTNINVTSEDLSMILNVGVLKGDAE